MDRLAEGRHRLALGRDGAVNAHIGLPAADRDGVAIAEARLDLGEAHRRCGVIAGRIGLGAVGQFSAVDRGGGSGERRDTGKDRQHGWLPFETDNIQQ